MTRTASEDTRKRHILGYLLNDCTHSVRCKILILWHYFYVSSVFGQVRNPNQLPIIRIVGAGIRTVF